MKTQEMNSQESKERKFEEKLREKGWAVLMFTYLYLNFCFNYHQNLHVEFKWNVYIFFLSFEKIFLAPLFYAFLFFSFE